MGFSIIETYFDAIILIQADVYEDERGIFMESYQREAFRALGIDEEFVQENHSVSALGVIRGIHFQWDKPMGKLLRVTSGRAHVKEIDIRKNSPTLGQSIHVELRASEPHLLWVPPVLPMDLCPWNMEQRWSINVRRYIIQGRSRA